MARNEMALRREADFKAMLNTKEMFGRAQAACGSKEAAKQFMASMLDLFHEGGDYLQGCDPNAIVAECFKAAQLNLPIIKSLGYAYVVPFKKVPTFVIGWKGLVQLAQNTGKFRYINADAVYEGETIKFNRLTGSIEISGERKSPDAPAIGYFAYIQLLNGFEKTIYMTKAEVEAYAAKYSPSYGSSSSPWKSEFDAMARKTVLRKVLKYAPASTEMREAEMNEVRREEAFVQSEVVQNANSGDVIDIPSTQADVEKAEAPTEAPAEETVPEPGF